ncbi:transposase [Streptomyces sp. NPDC093228]|uniref:transposase n=1 Tax=Streptomyces sp. NPDC093228 TaxID=3155070 RepID=UPI0034179AD3
MPKPYPEEFREDVVRVARNRGPGVTVEQVAADFGVHAMTLWKWMRRADIDDGTKPGTTSQDNAELREARRRIKLRIGQDLALVEVPHTIVTAFRFPLANSYNQAMRRGEEVRIAWKDLTHPVRWMPSLKKSIGTSPRTVRAGPSCSSSRRRRAWR